ncbi:TetR family transcriptional regulator [Sulfitobacter pacificus]|uniref:TetR family transcriptional regulator n=1 Tax=Sulfitobacter pacificus TaxID=1499314 RepID=A0ABQ5VE60_9RHOB|nr:TetR family transcriptional regulator [Sulfitobacter pacificus]
MAAGQDTKARVLDAAEKNFAALGFAGASMKAIARDAEVAQGLLHYHFHTKVELYQGVIARRSAAINEARFARLEQVDMQAPDAVEKVFEAFLAPPFDTGGVDTGYPQMLARLVVGDDLDQQLVRDNYDACAEKFIDALTQLLPDIERYQIAHSYTTAIGAMISAFSNTKRAESLANLPNEQHETSDETVQRLVRFCAAGTRAF